MRPLKESVGATSPIEAEAIGLLRSAPGHEPTAGQKQRVRARLLQQRVTHRAIVFRPVVVVSVVLCAAAASAAVGRHFIAEVVHSLVSPSARPPAAKGAASVSARRARDAVTTAPPTSDTAPGAPPAETAPETAPDASSFAEISTARPDGNNATTPRRSVTITRSATRSAARSRPSPPAVVETTPPPSPVAAVAPADPAPAHRNARAARPAEDTGLVFDAMRALRQEGQPARASGLLDEYMRRHPRGALAEEALALSVEAAMVRRDPRARALVAEYTARFPNGHFRAAVENARRRLAP